jgi:general secretion pathway protein G
MSVTFRRTGGGPNGYSFVELVVATFVMMILASAALPLARVSMRRQRETELHRDLRDMRTAIDKFKDMADRGGIAPTELQFGGDNYPTSLDQLVNGVTLAGDASGKKFKLLRRIPIDPVTGQADWGLRSYEDNPDSAAWGGQNVYNVYSKAPGVGLDGTKYKDW